MMKEWKKKDGQKMEQNYLIKAKKKWKQNYKKIIKKEK